MILLAYQCLFPSVGHQILNSILSSLPLVKSLVHNVVLFIWDIHLVSSVVSEIHQNHPYWSICLPASSCLWSLKTFCGCHAGRAVKSQKLAGSLNIQPVDPRRKICIQNLSCPLICYVTQVHHAPVFKYQEKWEFDLSVALANMMSLGPKIYELRCFANDIKPDLISLMKTWVYENTVSSHHFHQPGYNLCLKNYKSGIHRGVSLYINNSIKFKALVDLYHLELKVLSQCHYLGAIPALCLVQCTTLYILLEPVMQQWQTTTLLRLHPSRDIIQGVATS